MNPPTPVVIIPPPTPEERSGDMAFFVIGLQYGQYQHVRDALAWKSQLLVVQEPTNEHDPNAIGLWFNNSMKLGYVPRTKAALLKALELKSGLKMSMSAMVLKHNSEEESTIYNRLLVKLKWVLA